MPSGRLGIIAVVPGVAAISSLKVTAGMAYTNGVMHARLSLPPFWLDTASGNRINLVDPDPTHILLKDIAGGLSRLCRFGGQAREYFSVAQHALLVERIVAERGHQHLRLPALHHDSHEAFLCDIPSPLKKVMTATGEFTTWETLRAGFDEAIARALGIPTSLTPAEQAIIANADKLAFEIEAVRLLPNGGMAAISDHHGKPGHGQKRSSIRFPEPLSPTAAAEEFERVHRSLTTALAA
jgi:hypothetical protein